MRGEIFIRRHWENDAASHGRNPDKTYIPGTENVVITIDNANGSEDRIATVQAVADLLMALVERERDADEAQRKARADKAKAARLRAEADKLDPRKSTELDHLHVKVSVDASEIECNCCSCPCCETYWLGPKDHA